VGGWDTGLQQAGEDTDLWMRLTLDAPAHYVPYPLLDRRVHRASVLGSIGAEEQRRREAVMLAKWRRGDSLGAHGRETVRAAFMFRDRVFLPWLFTRAGTGQMRRGHVGAGLKDYARATRRILIAERA